MLRGQGRGRKGKGREEIRVRIIGKMERCRGFEC